MKNIAIMIVIIVFLKSYVEFRWLDSYPMWDELGIQQSRFLLLIGDAIFSVSVFKIWVIQIPDWFKTGFKQLPISKSWQEDTSVPQMIRLT